ncbi:hypothetical protein G7046_g7145 [Stylonectria norvegica]|nr:hypothetical protein G7046_g7145 [Stylonectria norvegica]
MSRVDRHVHHFDPSSPTRHHGQFMVGSKVACATAATRLHLACTSIGITTGATCALQSLTGGTRAGANAATKAAATRRHIRRPFGSLPGDKRLQSRFDSLSLGGLRWGLRWGLRRGTGKTEQAGYQTGFMAGAQVEAGWRLGISTKDHYVQIPCVRTKHPVTRWEAGRCGGPLPNSWIPRNPFGWADVEYEVRTLAVPRNGKRETGNGDARREMRDGREKKETEVISHLSPGESEERPTDWKVLNHVINHHVRLKPAIIGHNLWPGSNTNTEPPNLLELAHVIYTVAQRLLSVPSAPAPAPASAPACATSCHCSTFQSLSLGPLGLRPPRPSPRSPRDGRLYILQVLYALCSLPCSETLFVADARPFDLDLTPIKPACVMELSQQSIHDVIHPTAAFSEVAPDLSTGQPSEQEVEVEPSWEDSQLNPKNRIDGLGVLDHPLWRIDGCTAFGSQFYAVPLFMGQISPIRMDVFIPEPSKLDPELRRVLDVDVAFHTTSGPRISWLGITRHILRILQRWTQSQADPTQIYKNVPFGSRIVLNNMPVDIADASIIIAPTHYLERQLLSVSSLETYWENKLKLPPTIDIGDVIYKKQLHDSVCLVTIQGRTWIFKALTSYTKYLYHELKQLLTIPAHPNIVSRPVHLVTKKCSFGNKTAVIGFTLENHTYGSLRDLIPFMRIYKTVSLADETRWSIQLASALLHLRQTTDIYYPDLRLDNIVLSASRDAVMVDFEQRGVWCEFAAPEVNALEYIRILAIDEEIPPAVAQKYASILDEMLPGWESMGEGEEYIWPNNGYNVPWACLTRTEQEACEVYMLGRVLWCIFEGNSAPQRAAVWLSYRWEPLVEFPGYTHTPAPMRDLIDRCTRGRQPGMSSLIVRQQNQLVLREYENTGRSTPEEVQQTARDWWTREIGESELWLQKRVEGMRRGDWKENYYDRPTLQEVLKTLEAFRDAYGIAT